jgi:hypothetical protein
MMNLAVIMLAGFTVAGVAWGATCADVYKEVANMSPNLQFADWTRYIVWEPMVMSGGRIVRLSDVCVDGDTVRVQATGESMGKVAGPYYVIIKSVDRVGYDLIYESREVTLPSCQVVGNTGSTAPLAN